jgi:hypothetical protein
MASLEGWNFTIKLCPRGKDKLPRWLAAAKSFLNLEQGKLFLSL